MLGAARLVAFVSTSDPIAAVGFYRDRLGLELVESTPFACVFNAAGTMLRVTVVERVVPAPYTVLGWAVADLAVSLDRLTAAGIQTLRYEDLPQDPLGVWTSPAGARIAWFADPDGNLLSLTQS